MLLKTYLFPNILKEKNPYIRKTSNLPKTVIVHGRIRINGKVKDEHRFVSHNFIFIGYKKKFAMYLKILLIKFKFYEKKFLDFLSILDHFQAIKKL